MGRVLRVANRSELVERLNIPLVRPAGRRQITERKERKDFIRLLEDHVPLCPHVRGAGYDTLLLHEARSKTRPVWPTNRGSKRLIGRGWPKPGAALGLSLPGLAELSAALLST